jgi:hypothetical protein
LWEEARGHASAEDRVEEGRGVACFVLLREAARPEDKVNLLKLLLLAHDHMLRGSRCSPFTAERLARGGGEVLFEERDDVLGCHVP